MGQGVRHDAMDQLRSSAPETGLQWLRFAGNLANLSTPLGLLVARVGRADTRKGPRGLWLAESYSLSFPVAGAFTIGNVIIATQTWEDLLRSYPDLLAHEERHTWQYLYCLGLPYYLAYLPCMGWSWVRTGDRAAANFFERQAGLSSGGYLELPKRSIRALLRFTPGRGRLPG